MMFLKSRKLGRKVAFISLGLMALVLLAESIFSWSTAHKRINSEYIERANAATTSAAESMVTALWDLEVESLRNMASGLIESPDINAVTITEVSGKVIASAQEQGIELIKPYVVTSEIRAPYMRNVTVLGTLSVTYNRDSVQQELRQIAYISAIRGLVSCLLFFGIMLWTIRSLVSPIKALETTIDQYNGREQINYVPGEDREDELGSLARGFKAMSSQIYTDVAMLEEHVESRTKELKVALEKASAANVAKSEFLATMSHEIRTPMNGVLGMAQVLKKTPLVEQQQFYIDVILRSGNDLMQIINDILDFSKIEADTISLNLKSKDLKHIFNHAVALLMPNANEKGVKLNCSVDHSLPAKFMIDSQRFNQIITNIIGNAIKFTHEGSVYINVTGEASSKQGFYDLCVEIKDTGIGIPKDKLDIIFDKFTQAETSTTRTYGGTGLGLAISRELVIAMGGTLTVRSELGEGSTFFINLSLEADLAADMERKIETQIQSEQRSVSVVSNAGRSDLVHETTTEKSTQQKTDNRIKILLAEDNEINQQVIKTMLSHPKINLTIVDNGHKAVELFNTESFHMILMDISMPVLDGIQATRIIRRQERENKLKYTPIICLSAHAMEKDKQKVLEAGMDHYLSKPISRQKLLEIIVSYLRPQASAA